MSKQLPERSNLEQLKNQAKDLLHDVRAGRPEAVARIGNENRETFALHDAQRVLGREHGFASWTALKLHVEARDEDQAEAQLILAALEGREPAVRRLLADRPALGSRSLFAAAALGDATGVRAWLARDPGLARVRGGPRQAEAIVYLAFGSVGGDDAARTPLATELLTHGASPNAGYLHPDWPDALQPVLYGATGANSYPQLARVLLDAGADPNDCESRYHAAERHHVACLELLREYGTDFNGADRVYGNTPLYFLLGYHHPPAAVTDGIRWLLEHGADPDTPSLLEAKNETALHAAIRLHWPMTMIALLLDHGADLLRPRLDGRTPYALAVRGARDDLLDLFRARGVPDVSSPTDRFLGACMRGDGPAARELLRRDPGLLEGLTDDDRSIVHEAAEIGRAGALRLMGELGFDLARRDCEQITPLHWASWHGWAEAVRVLVAAGSPIDAVDGRFHGIPIGWCSHGSLHARNPQGDYAATAEALVAGGATIPEKSRKGWEASGPVLAVLRKRGLVP